MKVSDGWDSAVPSPQPEFVPVLERSLDGAAARFSPHTEPDRLTATARAAERRRQRRHVRAICLAGALFGAGVVGLGLPVRMDAGKVSVGLPHTTSVPPAPTTTTPASTFVAFSTIPPSPPVTTIASTQPTTTPPPTTLPSTTGATAALGTTASRTTAAVRQPSVLPVATTPTSRPSVVPATPSTSTIAPPTAPTTQPPTTQPATTQPITTPAPPIVPLTAHWRSSNCIAPVFSAFFGTGQPGSVVTISGPNGSADVTVDSSGQWERFEVFAGITAPPVITISSPQGSLQPACGS
jgi:hypothetical protein